jgi:hypothetical protein
MTPVLAAVVKNTRTATEKTDFNKIMENTNSDKTQDLLKNIQKFSPKKLKMLDDIGILYNQTEIDKASLLFSELIFIAKSICGLKSVLLNRPQTEESKKNLIKEYQANMNLVSKKIMSILEHAGFDTKISFKEKYFGTDEKSLHNFIELIDDLGVCKDYFNSLQK